MRNGEMDARHVFVIAGEASGDLHASGVIRELCDRRPDLRVSGIGGRRLQEAGVALIHHSDQLSFMGFAEVVRHLPFVRRVMGDVRTFLAEHRPALVVLVDYPAFNLRVAGFARALGCRILYYISPQVWAWHEERVVKLSELADVLACVLPFEEEFFEEKSAEYGISPDVRYVGHPLVDTAVPMTSPEVFRGEMLLPPDTPLVALLPGSRRQEISRLLPHMAEAFLLLREDFPGLIPVLGAAPGVDDDTYERCLRGTGLSRAPHIPPEGVFGPDDGLHIVRGRTYDLLSAARGALVASGTATLETAILGTPMVITYRMNLLSWWIGRSRVKVPHIGLVNLVAGRRLVPELLQNGATGAALAAQLKPQIEEGPVRDEVVEGLAYVRERLGEGGAAGRTADIAEELLDAASGGVVER